MNKGNCFVCGVSDDIKKVTSEDEDVDTYFCRYCYLQIMDTEDIDIQNEDWFLRGYNWGDL